MSKIVELVIVGHEHRFLLLIAPGIEQLTGASRKPSSEKWLRLFVFGSKEARSTPPVSANYLTSIVHLELLLRLPKHSVCR